MTRGQRFNELCELIAKYSMSDPRVVLELDWEDVCRALREAESESVSMEEAEFFTEGIMVGVGIQKRRAREGQKVADFSLLSDAELQRHIEEWLASKGAGEGAVEELADVLQQHWASMTRSEAKTFADGMLCGIYLMRP